MTALLFSLLALNTWGAARVVHLHGEYGAFRLDAQFRERSGAPAVDRFHLAYDAHKLGHTLEHRYLKSIFGKRNRELGAADVEVYGLRHQLDPEQGIDADFLVLRVRGSDVLGGYFGIGVETDASGFPYEDAKVILIEGHLTGLQAVLHNMVAGRDKYYLRPILTCQRALSAQRPLEVATD